MAADAGGDLVVTNPAGVAVLWAIFWSAGRSS